MKYSVASTHDRGFSLVEVMVAVVVICVGLLGIAKMQALAVSNTTTSRLRALAAIEAAGLAAAMHSNREYWAGTATAAPATTNFNVTTAGQFASSDAVLQAAANGALPIGLNTPDTIQTCVGVANGIAVCGGTGGVVNLAAFDLARWAASLNALLPNPQATILCPPAVGAAPQSCTIQIQWSEKAVGMNQQEAQNLAQGQFELPSYLLYVEP
jgi:type IV pilus assembly protein PilV